MGIRAVDASSSEQRLLQAMVYDLQSFSAALAMQKPFARTVKEALPLVAALLGAPAEERARRDFGQLMNDYEILGHPDRILAPEHEAYLGRVRAFSRHLMGLVESNFPIVVELTSSHVRP